MPGKPSMGRPDCRGTNKNGTPCKRKATAGSAYCGSHGGGKRIGKPSTLDADMINRLSEAVEHGVTWTIAAQAVGIHETTLYGWRDKGSTDLDNGNTTTPHALLVDALSRARARAEQRMVELVRSHAAEDWRAAAWFLERSAPGRWGRRDSLDVSTQERAKPRDVVPEGEPQRDRILAMLAAATAPPTPEE